MAAWPRGWPVPMLQVPAVLFSSWPSPPSNCSKTNYEYIRDDGVVGYSCADHQEYGDYFGRPAYFSAA